MTSANFWRVTTLVLAATLAALLFAEPDRADIRLDAKTIAMLKRLFPSCDVTDLKREKEDGEHITKVRLQDAEGKENILAKLTDGGEVLDLDEDMEINEIPPHIEKAFRKAFPEAKLLHLEKGTRMEISYRLDIQQGDRKHEVKISRRGRIFEVESRK